MAAPRYSRCVLPGPPAISTATCSGSGHRFAHCGGGYVRPSKGLGYSAHRTCLRAILRYRM
eukprot:scaffold20391_cov129-Isochrysis_galbana.AAC.3